MVCTRLECDKGVGATSRRSGLCKCEHLGMRLSGARMVALTHDAAVGDDDAAHNGIGPGGTGTTKSELGSSSEIRVRDPN